MGMLKTSLHFRVVVFLAAFSRVASEICTDNTLGMQSGAIPDNNITASSVDNSNTPAKNARLHYTSGQSWCASRDNNENAYLQIDLGTTHIICAVATQGNPRANQWVKTYQIQTSTNGITWSDYTEEGKPRVFVANADRDSVVKRTLVEGVAARMLRFLPKNYSSFMCLRAEVFGIKHQQAWSVNLALHKPTNQSSTGWGGVSSRAVDGRRNKAYGENSCTHTLLNDNAWWRVDLGEVHPVSRVFVVNRIALGYRLDNFELRIGTNDTGGGTFNPKCGDKYSIASARASNIYCSPAMEGRYVYIRLPGRTRMLTLCEVEVYDDGDVCSQQAIQNSNRTELPNNRWTASSSKSGNKPFDARLDGVGAWAPGTNLGADYLQIDLRSIYVICALATQGNPNEDEWTMSYQFKTSVDKVHWKVYSEKHSENTFLTGNRDRNSVTKSVLLGLNQARFVRFVPAQFHGGKALRVKIFGVLQGIIAPPTDLRVSNIQSRSATLHWENPAADNLIQGSEFANAIQYSKTTETRLIFTKALRSSQSLAGLMPHMEYKVKVRVDNNAGQGLWSAEERFTTDSDVPEEPPTLKSLTALTSQSIKVTWQEPDKINGVVLGYTLLYKKKGQNSFTRKTLPGPVTSATLQNLESSTEYEVKVQVFNDKGSSPASRVESARTLDTVHNPVTPDCSHGTVNPPLNNSVGTSSTAGEKGARVMGPQNAESSSNNSAVLAIGVIILFLLILLVILVIVLVLKLTRMAGKSDDGIHEYHSTAKRALIELQPVSEPPYQKL